MVSQERLDEFDRKTLEKIEQYGFTVMYIFPTEEGEGHAFSYTTGLTDKGKPELLVTVPLRHEDAHAIISDLANRDGLKAGDVIKDVLADGLSVTLIEADPVAAEMNMALHLYGHDKVAALQVVFPDKENRFPWDGWSMDDEIQPLYRKGV